MNRLNYYLIFILTFLTNSLLAWTASVHMIIAQGAYERLDPEVKKKVDSLIAVLPFQTACSFMQSAALPDYVRREGLTAFNQWHASWRPFDPDHILSEERKKEIAAAQLGNDAIYAVTHGIETLKNKSASPFAKAWMLAFLVHCTGELHQPIHTITLFNRKFPEGDRKGSAFMLCLKGDRLSLHHLWDTAGELYPKLTTEPLTKREVKMIIGYCNDLKQRFPDKPSEAILLDPSVWREESFQIASKYAYQGISPHTEVSEAYLKQTREICERQITLATYRLANLLNEVFKDE